MRRASAVVVLLAGLCLPPVVQAQSRGGSRSFAGRSGGMARGFSGFRQAPAPFRGGGFSGFRGTPAPFGRGGFRSPLSRPSSFGRRRGPARGFLPGRRSVLGWRSFAYPTYFPTYGYGGPLSYAGFPSDYGAPEESEAVAPQQDDALAGQVQQLSDEVAQLRDQQGSGWTEPAPAPYAPAEEDSVSAVLVYRDGHQIEARNYAVYGQSVWVFGNGTTHKVALADLNLQATRKLNDERGDGLVLPSTP